WPHEPARGPKPGFGPGSIFLEQLAPAIRVEVFAAAVRTDEGANPGAGPSVLLDAFESVHAVGARQRAAVQMRVSVDLRRSVCVGGTDDRAVGSGHSPSLPRYG